MKSGARRSFFFQWTVLGLVMLLGPHEFIKATPLEKEVSGRKQDTLSTKSTSSKKDKPLENDEEATSTKTAPSKEDKTLESDEEATSKDKMLDEEDGPPQKPRLRKPKPLEPTKLAQEDPLEPLDKLIVKQQVSLAPYVPLVQTIDVSLDYGRLAMNLWTPQERRYVGSLGILWRKNIQLSGTWGYNQLHPALVHGNKSAYAVKGHYGSLGLAYFIKEDRYNLYAGLRHGRSYFTNTTVPPPPVVSEDLSASWWELTIGSEQRLFKNLGIYAGLMLHLKGFGSFEAFKPASNYVVPGYGRNVSSVAPSVSLYIKYQLSFLEKQISFSAPKTN